MQAPSPHAFLRYVRDEIADDLEGPRIPPSASAHSVIERYGKDAQFAVGEP
jgi:hypothetical protein